MQTLAMSPRGRVVILFGLSIFLVAVTRLPLMPAHLYSFDSVNLALALEDFDPARNQPQYPGYPLYVAEARLVNRILGSPERTFTALKILISGLAVAALYLLGKELFSSWLGMLAAALLFVNPVFWRSGLVSSLRLHLALIAILVAYCCWRSLSGKQRYFYIACILLGLGGGFRAELPLILLPLLAWTGWQSDGRRLLFRGAVLFLGASLVWFAALLIAPGGLGRLIASFTDYLVSQTQQTSLLLDAPLAGSRRMAGSAIVWNTLGILPWIWALPLGWRQRHQVPEYKRRWIFLAVWFVPAFLFNLVVHTGSPGHVLTTIPVLCLVGAYCLGAAEQWVGCRWNLPLKEQSFVVWIALLGNLLLFFGEFQVPQREPVRHFRGLASVADAFLIGRYRSSYDRVRWVEQMTRLGLQQIHHLKSTTDRPVRVVWSRDGEPVWRKISFYVPTERVWVMDEAGDPAVPASKGRLWQRNQVLMESAGTSPIRVPVPKNARLIWVVSPGVVDSLARSIPLREASPLYYTDLPSDFSGFRWGSFEFVPK